ncbi:MAG: metallophosphoesterase [Candidatus Omnitrophica bacterium]|nr:metallophosphoesterase [Candidatus Omnitrophota bacterium]
MKIGIISDTHDNVVPLSKAINYFLNSDIEALVHAGDFVAPFVFREIKRLPVPLYAVFGNCDGEINGLSTMSNNHIKKAPYRFRLADKNIVVVHDIATLRIDEEIQNNNADIIIHGHTHTPEITTHGKVLIINPGECCGIVNGIASCATLDLNTIKALIHTL